MRKRSTRTGSSQLDTVLYFCNLSRWGARVCTETLLKTPIRIRKQSKKELETHYGQKETGHLLVTQKVA